MGCNRLQVVRPHGPYTAPNFWSLVRLDLVAQISTQFGPELRNCGLWDYDPPAPQEMIVVIGIMQNIFILYRQSVLDAQDIKPAMVFALGILRKLGAIVCWERADRFGFDPRLIDHMNERLK